LLHVVVYVAGLIFPASITGSDQVISGLIFDATSWFIVFELDQDCYKRHELYADTLASGRHISLINIF
jgi:hypothetical protein